MHPILCLVSSNIFGLEFFTTGLTKHELNDLTKFKLIGTVLLENLPQLVIQVIYSKQLNTITQSTYLASSASLLAVIATVLAWYISRDNNFDGTFVNYYIIFKQEYGRSPTFINRKTITKEEERNFIKYRWKRFRLSKALSKVIHVPRTNIETGYVYLTDNGCIIHIIQSISNTDINNFKQTTNINKQDSITPLLICKRLYTINKTHINKVFINHFKVDGNLFTTDWNDKYPKLYSDKNFETELMHVSLNSNSFHDNDKMFTLHEVKESINIVKTSLKDGNIEGALTHVSNPNIAAVIKDAFNTNNTLIRPKSTSQFVMVTMDDRESSDDSDIASNWKTNNIRQKTISEGH